MTLSTVRITTSRSPVLRSPLTGRSSASRSTGSSSQLRDHLADLLTTGGLRGDSPGHRCGGGHRQRRPDQEGHGGLRARRIRPRCWRRAAAGHRLRPASRHGQIQSYAQIDARGDPGCPRPGRPPADRDRRRGWLSSPGHPAGFLYRDGRLLLTARARVTWLSNLRRDPRVCVCVDESRYPLRKVTIKGRAEISFEPGRDDEWRDLRLPLADAATTAPGRSTRPARNGATTPPTASSPTTSRGRWWRFLWPGATVTSWRLPVEGELVGESWAHRYYEHTPRRFRVVRSGTAA